MIYHAIFLPLLSGIIAQVIKFLYESASAKKLLWCVLFRYGGFPSSHSATMVSLATAVWLTEGAGSMAFAVATVMSFVVIRDALGIRKKLEIAVGEQFGHTPLEVGAGAILGFFITLAGFSLF